MAMPSSSSNTLQMRWQRIKDTNGYVKNQCDSLIAQVTVTRRRGLEIANLLADALSALDALTVNAIASGLLAYAQAQENDPALDIPAAYSAMRTQIVATQDWLVANFPKDGSGNLAVYVFNGGKRFADVPLSAGELVAFKAQLTALAATID